MTYHKHLVLDLDKGDITGITLSAETDTVSGDQAYIREGTVNGSSFLGNPKKYTIAITPPLPNNSYVVLVESEAIRNWTIENKTIAGFRINAQANKSFTEDVNWQIVQKI